MKIHLSSFVIVAILALYSITMMAQVAVNTDGGQPDPSAGLDVKFTDKGFLPPRLTHAQMNAIVSPANGLIIYCTDCSNAGTGTLAMYVNNAWVMFAPNCILPLYPSSGLHFATPSQITWTWEPVADATGYKWNTENDILTATDMSDATTKTETGLSCLTPYTRFVWAYNLCGVSVATTLTQTTSGTVISPPTVGVHIPSLTGIVWNWNAVTGATGYKWSSTNNFALATDMGAATTNTETGLTCNTAYTRFAWAYDACGNSEALELNQATSACQIVTCGDPITDPRDDKTYNTVLIGTQCWMAQSLDIGTMINGSENQADNGLIEKYCFGDLASNCETYGGLYQWGELVGYLNGTTNTTSWDPIPTGNIQGICPAGWHIPSDGELVVLTDFLGGEAISGGKMKESGFTHWLSPNTGATNESGLTLLGSGARINGNFPYFNTRTYLRSSSEFDESFAIIRRLINTDMNALNATAPKTYGLNVRCVKN